MLLDCGPLTGEEFLDHLPVFGEHLIDEDPREGFALREVGLGKLLVEDRGNDRLEADPSGSPVRVAGLAGLPAVCLQVFGTFGQ